MVYMAMAVQVYGKNLTFNLQTLIWRLRSLYALVTRCFSVSYIGRNGCIDVMVVQAPFASLWPWTDMIFACCIIAGSVQLYLSLHCAYSSVCELRYSELSVFASGNPLTLLPDVVGASCECAHCLSPQVLQVLLMQRCCLSTCCTATRLACCKYMSHGAEW